MMSLYLANEGMLEVPEGWMDKSITALSFPAGVAKPEASFAMTRDPAAAQSGSLTAYVDKQIVDMAKGCPRFELINRQNSLLAGGASAQSVEFSWRSPDGTTVRQLQAIVLLATGTALVMTATAPRDKFPRYAPVFQSMIASFRFHS